MTAPERRHHPAPPPGRAPPGTFPDDHAAPQQGQSDSRRPIIARVGAIGALALGLAASPLFAGADPRPPLIAGALALAGLAALRLGRVVASRSASFAVSLALLVAAAAALGLGAGTWRLAAIDAGAATIEPGERYRAVGHVATAPRRSSGRVRILLATADGRLLVEAREPVADLATGDALSATGRARTPLPWEAAALRRQGASSVLAAGEVRRLEAGRDGLRGALDGVRARVEAALGRGAPDAPARLLRGFVLGQDDRIDQQTVDAFRRSGLAHLLAVSGTNVMLLSLLAIAVLGALGVPARARMLWVLALIAIYVPVAGAGPSIQRAGVMGVAGALAVLASRPRSRGYALLLAAAATLAWNPRASGEVGWQLSFAAVTGIALWAGPIRELLESPDPGRRGPLRRALAEGAGLTIAATVATAPLMAHHFDAFSITSLPANLLALPAVAPMMWLGMAAGAVGQVPELPVEPLTAVAAALAAYVGQMAVWLAAPSWALLEVELRGPLEVAGAYALLATALVSALGWSRRRRALRPRRGARSMALLATSLAMLWVAPGAAGLVAPERGEPPPAGSLAVTVLDVGQGDAILLEPGGADPILVDAGPPGAGVAARLRELGVERLGALIVTHPDSDHAGGGPEVLESVPTAILAQAGADRPLARQARALGTRTVGLAAGDALRSGALRLRAIWPPRRLIGIEALREQHNRLSVVLVGRFHGFRILLTGDAEAEVTPLDPGPVDVLKVAHHGSEDSGLPGLLGRSRPRLAVISAGEGNAYGHPAAETLEALEEAGVPTLRTDLAGEIRVEAARDGWAIAAP